MKQISRGWRLGRMAATVAWLGWIGWMGLGAGMVAAAQERASGPASLQANVDTRTELRVEKRQQGEASETVFTAHVTDAAGRTLAGDGGDSVSFDTAAGSLGAALLDAEGDATLVVESLPVNGDGSGLAVRAVFHSGAQAAAGTANRSSGADTVQLEPQVSGVPDFTVTANPSTLSVTPGAFGTSVVTISPLNGFNEQVTLSCSNLPAQATCTFSPVIGSTASGAFTSTLQVQTQAPSGSLDPPPFGLGSHTHLALAVLLPGVLGLAGFASRRRRALRGVRLGSVALLLLAGAMGLGGCNPRYGYEHHPPSVATGTLAGTYTINIAASGNNGSSVDQHNISLVLTVQ